MVVGDHVGPVDSGKRLIRRVFEQRRGAHGEWIAHAAQVDAELLDDVFGKSWASAALAIFRSSVSLSAKGPMPELLMNCSKTWVASTAVAARRFSFRG